MYTKEQFTKDFKKILIDSGCNVNQLAPHLNKSQAALNKQVLGATFRYVDLVNILDMLGYDVVWVKRHNANSEKDWGVEKPSAEKA